MTVAPRFNWGRNKPQMTRGSSHARFIGEDMTLRMTTDAPLAYVLSNTPFLVTRGYNFILGPDETLTQGVEETARDFEQETTSYWRLWTRRLAVPREWQEAVIRAAITLKLSLYEETGAIVAAASGRGPPGCGHC